MALVAGCQREKNIDPLAHKGSNSQWLMHRGPGGDGVSPDTVNPPLGLMWKVKLKAGVRAAPVADLDRVYVASLDGRVQAFNRLKGGKPVWTFKTNGSIVAPPALDDGVLYVGSEDGSLYAIDAATGKRLRAFATENDMPIHGGPVVGGNYVIFGANDNYIYALPKDNFSQIQWHKNTGDWVEAAPAVADGFVYAGSNSGRVYKYKLISGDKLWSFKTGGPVYSTPVVSKGVVYFTSWDGHVYAVNAKSGKRLWRTRVDEQVSGSLALHKGVLYGGAMFPDGPLFAVRAKDGRLLHSFNTAGGFDAAPVISGHTLYIGSFDDNFYAVDVKDFQIKWKRPMRDPVRATCAVANRTVFAADLKGRLFAFAPID